MIKRDDEIRKIEQDAARRADCLAVLPQYRRAFIEHYVSLFRHLHAYHVITRQKDIAPFSHAFVLFPILDEHKNRRCHLLYELKDGSLFYGMMVAKTPSYFNPLNASSISTWKKMRGRMHGGAQEEDDILSPDSIVLNDYAREKVASVIGGLCRYKTSKLSISARSENQKSLRAELEVTYKRLAYGVMREFIAKLNQQNIDLVRRSGMYSVWYYNFLAADGDVQRSMRRRQACEIYPLLSSNFSSRVLKNAIDDALPLVNFIGEFLQIPPSVVRLFENIDMATIGESGYVKTSPMYRVLKNMPHTGHPKSPADWAVLYKMAYPLLYLCNGRNLIRKTDFDVAFPLSKCLYPFRHGWVHGLARLSEQVPGDLAQKVTFARDMLSDIHRYFWEKRFGVKDIWTNRALSRLSLLELLRVSERWHQEVPKIHAAAVAQDEALAGKDGIHGKKHGGRFYHKKA